MCEREIEWMCERGYSACQRNSVDVRKRNNVYGCVKEKLCE